MRVSWSVYELFSRSSYCTCTLILRKLKHKFRMLKFYFLSIYTTDTNAEIKQLFQLGMQVVRGCHPIAVSNLPCGDLQADARISKIIIIISIRQKRTSCFVGGKNQYWFFEAEGKS